MCGHISKHRQVNSSHGGHLAWRIPALERSLKEKPLLREDLGIDGDGAGPEKLSGDICPVWDQPQPASLFSVISDRQNSTD